MKNVPCSLQMQQRDNIITEMESKVNDYKTKNDEYTDKVSKRKSLTLLIQLFQNHFMIFEFLELFWKKNCQRIGFLENSLVFSPSNIEKSLNFPSCLPINCIPSVHIIRSLVICYCFIKLSLSFSAVLLHQL